LDAKGSIRLDVKKDNRIFLKNFIICENFPYEAIIGAKFLKSSKVLLDVANERLVYPANSSPLPVGVKKDNRVGEEVATVTRIQSFESHFSPRRGHCIAGNLPSSQNREVNLNNKEIESAKIKTGDMRRYRSNEIKEILELWKKVVNPNAVHAQPTLLAEDMTQYSSSINSIDNKSEEKD
jgi:hypothetical protein